MTISGPMQKFSTIEDDLDVAVSLQSYVKTSGHSSKTVQKCLLKMIKVNFEITA
jgi:hypothetical protein